MSQIYEITMKSKDPEATISRIIYRVKGLTREEAKQTAVDTAGVGYEIYYVIAGPRLDE